jgi:MFS family permease
MNAKLIIRNFTIFSLLNGLGMSFFFGTYQLFLLSKGFDLLEMNLINLSFMVFVFLFEVPTGLIADFFGRKVSVIVGLCLYSLSFFWYFLAGSFWQCLGAEIVGALAATCISGALDALVVDSLKSVNYTGSINRVFSRGEISQLSVVVGAFLGGLVAEKNLAWPWFLSGVSFAVLAVVSIFLFKEVNFSASEETKKNIKSFKNLFNSSMKDCFKNKQLMLIALFSALMAFSLQAINMYWPLVLKESFNFSPKVTGLFFSLICVALYLGAQFSKLWTRKIICQKRAIFFSQIITLVGILACALIPNFYFFAFFLLFHEFGRGLFKPMYKTYVNSLINSENRATVLSFESMISKIGAGAGLLFSGLIAKSFGITSSWVVSAVILGLGIFIFWFSQKNKKTT